MIINFGNKATEDVYNGLNSKAARRFPQSIRNVAYRKMDMINAANDLRDLKIPLSNRLEKLKGKLSEYYSIRINDQFRIVFKWNKNNAEQVLITDYH